MDILQKMILLLTDLIDRIKNIGILLSSNNLPSDDKKWGFDLFWFF